MSELLLIISCSVKVKAKGYIADVYTKGITGLQDDGGWKGVVWRSSCST